jgi:probable addiction module antidote protein
MNEDVADYVNDMLADGDASLVQHALGVAFRAAGMMKVCQATGLTPQGINKATRLTSKPSFQTVLSIAQGLGLQLRFLTWRGESARPEPRSSSPLISDI